MCVGWGRGERERLLSCLAIWLAAHISPHHPLCAPPHVTAHDDAELMPQRLYLSPAPASPANQNSQLEDDKAASDAGAECQRLLQSPTRRVNAI